MRKLCRDILILSSLLMASLTLTHGITEAALIKDGVEGQPPIQIANAYKLNFTNQVKAGYQSVRYDPNRGAQLYDSSLGYGFVQETNALPAREVHTDSITSDGTGFFITESYFLLNLNLKRIIIITTAWRFEWMLPLEPTTYM